MEIKANMAQDISAAYSKYYSLLADAFARLIGPSRGLVVLEGGCGQGQLTIPLLRKLSSGTRLIGVDLSRGAYDGWLDELRLKVNRMGLSKKVRLVNTDVRRLRGIKRASIDVIVSNELICDLSQKDELNGALNEFHRVLRLGGRMFHGEWASQPADRDVKIRHWPAWNPDQLFSLFTRVGFYDVNYSYFGTTIKFGYEAALKELVTWGASARLILRNRKALRQNGLYLPFEHIVSCIR